MFFRWDAKPKVTQIKDLHKSTQFNTSIRHG